MLSEAKAHNASIIRLAKRANRKINILFTVVFDIDVLIRPAESHDRAGPRETRAK